ncbi:hypothetical protein L9G74_11540 [Shewanella sp. C32]|uniref:Uncharacterized protein n=1 Tax=Shewanella electrica TaxID=515560 RepID=A0ABT2FL71_9GAMM|nr:hypothetical protein [Shewanella electrica]MCH1923858.1 hypothetical protein [Shewanella electrica]MCS4557077.1 hypothetical protein [Shewanella electrica]
MEKTISLGLLFIAGLAQAGELDIAHRYQQILENRHEKAQTIQQLEGILADVSNDHPLYKDIYSTYLNVKGVNPNDELNLAVAFTTGNKVETFCRGIGMVKATLNHNDGTETTLLLTGGKRVLEKDQYAIADSGRWQYQLNNRYHDNVTSEVWINQSNSKRYDIEEQRKSSQGIEKGSWVGAKVDGHFDVSVAQKYFSKEPVGMSFAMDYQTWGTPDLGYNIDFIQGSKQTLSSAVNLWDQDKAILLNSVRTVSAAVKTVNVESADGGRYMYGDCYNVETSIHFAGLKEMPH